MKGTSIVAGLVASTFALAACSTDKAATVTTPQAKKGTAVLGAPISVWQAGHTPSASGSATGFGPAVSVNGRMVDEYTAVVVVDGRVGGWHMSFPPDTILARAEQLVRQQLPADIRQSGSGRLTAPTSGFCEFVNYQSRAVATTLDVPIVSGSEGNIGVRYYEATSTGARSSSIRVVNSADIETRPINPTQSC